MRKLMHVLFLSCLKATELIEKKIHFKLSFTENFQLKFHKMMCEACKHYEKQSVFIENKLIANQNIKGVNIDIDKFKEQLKK